MHILGESNRPLGRYFREHKSARVKPSVGGPGHINIAVTAASSTAKDKTYARPLALPPALTGPNFSEKKSTYTQSNETIFCCEILIYFSPRPPAKEVSALHATAGRETYT